jgi:hypothetical protein
MELPLLDQLLAVASLSPLSFSLLPFRVLLNIAFSAAVAVDFMSQLEGCVMIQISIRVATAKVRVDWVTDLTY